MNPYQVVKDFEQTIADFAGSRFAVAVDSCTNALFLCCKYLEVETVSIPNRTYVSVPCSIIHAGGSVEFEDYNWHGTYQLKPYPIFDAACQLIRRMYQEKTYQCISFSSNKPLNIGKGGMILHDDPVADKWLRMARYEGRNEVSILEDEFVMLGWNMYMTPEMAARGLLLSSHLKDEKIVYPQYPDLSKFEIYTQPRQK
jgi:dTDP-4-amino-4,6-dideoxygalactose transaminase